MENERAIGAARRPHYAPALRPARPLSPGQCLAWVANRPMIIQRGVILWWRPITLGMHNLASIVLGRGPIATNTLRANINLANYPPNLDQYKRLI